MKFVGPPTTKWRPFKFFSKSNGNHLLMANIFKLHEFQTFGILSDISFDRGFQKIVPSSLLLLSCACYYVDLGDIQWNEVANRRPVTSTIVHPYTPNMINRCPNIWFIKISKCQQFSFWKKSHQKTQIFIFLKKPLFCNGWPYWYEYWRWMRSFCGLSKKVQFRSFFRNITKLMSIWMSKVVQK